MNITSIWEDFEKESSSFDGLEEVLDFVATKYGMSKDEVIELMRVSNLAIADYFDISELTKKTGFLKRKSNKRVYSSALAVFINGVFFGMFLSNFLSQQEYSPKTSV